MLAVANQVSDTSVQVAIIGAISAIIIAVFSLVGILITNRSTRQTRQAIGSPNGHGNVVEMTERILIEQGRNAEKLDQLHEKLHETASDLNVKIEEHTQQDDRNFRAINDRISQLERVY